MMYLYLGSCSFLIYFLCVLVKSSRTYDNVKSHGSGFLRQGAFVFGIGSFIYHLLEFITHFIIDFHPNCLDVLHTVNSFLSIIFVLLQVKGGQQSGWSPQVRGLQVSLQWTKCLFCMHGSFAPLFGILYPASIMEKNFQFWPPDWFDLYWSYEITTSTEIKINPQIILTCKISNTLDFWELSYSPILEEFTNFAASL